MGGEKTVSGVLFNSDLPTIDEEESSETSVETDDEQDEGGNALNIFADDKEHDVEVFNNYFWDMISLRIDICFIGTYFIYVEGTGKLLRIQKAKKTKETTHWKWNELM